jgi:excisionase family DNA binding protein
MNPQQLALDVAQLARLLSLAPTDAAKMLDDGELPVVEIGGVRRVRVADVEKYVGELQPVTP